MTKREAIEYIKQDIEVLDALPDKFNEALGILIETAEKVLTQQENQRERTKRLIALGREVEKSSNK